MRRVPYLLLLLSCWAQAQHKGETDPQLDVVPLIDMEAPQVAVWFYADRGIPFDDSAALEEQVFEDFFKRMDIRMLPRDKVMTGLQHKQRALTACRGDDACVIAIGLALGVDRMVAVHVEGSHKDYRIALACFDLRQSPPTVLNSVVEGNLTDLLIGGAAGAVAALFENPDQFEPVDDNVLARAVALLKSKETPAARPEPDEPEPPADASTTEAATPEHPEDAQTEETEEPTAAAGQDVRPEVAVTGTPRRAGFFKVHLGSTIVGGSALAVLLAGAVCGTISKIIESSWQPDTVYDNDKNNLGINLATSANVMFALAGAGAAVWAYLFFMVEREPAREPSVALTIAPRGVFLTLRF